jgi:hypothetical protein
MDIQAILKQLREERDQLDVSILAIERLAAGKHRGPGRPPKWLADAAKPAKRQTVSRGAEKKSIEAKER